MAGDLVAVEIPNSCSTVKNGLSRSRFSIFDLSITAVSLFIYVTDIVTDLVLGGQYLRECNLEWGFLTIFLCVLPLVVTQLISIRWHLVDGMSRQMLPLCLVHCSLLGVVERYCMVVKEGLVCWKNDTEESVARLLHHQSDICLLRLFESFLESAPQLLLQLYIMHELRSWDVVWWTGVCALASLVSLAWGIASYARTMRNVREDKANISWIGLTLQAVWRTGTVCARLVSLVLVATVIHKWLILALAIHWLAMTIWVLKQHTDLCVTAWEERIYNAVIGVIYCFCFFNLKEGQSRTRAITFYTIIAAENVACLAFFMKFPEQHDNDQWLHSYGPVLVVVGSLLGHSSQLIYYRWFHPSGPIKIIPSGVRTADQSETAERAPPVLTPSLIRTLKCINPIISRKSSGVSLPSLPADPSEVKAQTDSSKIDPLAYDSSEAAVDVGHLTFQTDDPKEAKQLTSSCSDSKLNCNSQSQRSSKMVKSKSCDNMISWPKDRLHSILQTTEENGSDNSPTSSIASPTIVASTIDDGDDDTTSTCPSSVHDYENMPCVNVNRTDWGVRHWTTYSDIETSCHDNSVCRDRDLLSDTSLVSAASSDTERKISVQEAIYHLKSLAHSGHNIFQNVQPPSSNGLYECIWMEAPATVESAPLPKPCPPTRGHNLSTISEESERCSSSSVSSSRVSSTSCLVRTVDAIMDESQDMTEGSFANPASLTYDEVDFLSQLAAKGLRRQFSVVRAKFAAPGSNPRKVASCADACTASAVSKSTLSPKSRIFSS